MDWMNCLKGGVTCLLDPNTGTPAASSRGETDAAESMIEMLNDVLNKKQEAADHLNDCKGRLGCLKEETAAAGWPLLDAEYECQVEAWKLLVAQCVEAKERVQAQSSTWHNCELSLNDLASWLKSVDVKVSSLQAHVQKLILTCPEFFALYTKVKEQSALKPSADAKGAQLEKLNHLLKELDSRGSDIARSTELARKATGASDTLDSKLSSQASVLSTRYQNLKTHVKVRYLNLKSCMHAHICF